MPASKLKCPLCGSEECESRSEHNRLSFEYRCERCGWYRITDRALTQLPQQDAWKLGPYVIEQNRRGVTPRFLSSQTKEQAGEPDWSVGIDTAIASFPNTVSERLDRALVNMAGETSQLGQGIAIENEGPTPVILARNANEAFTILDYLASEGLIAGGRPSRLPARVALSARGLMKASELEKGLLGAKNRQAFVAMSFDPALYPAYAEGLKLGIEDCDYKPLRVDAKEHNEKICDTIIAEIKNSKFLVADFTLHRSGVYFEAGLMMGLGRPVIFTVRSDELGKAHFDTRQYNHIEWSDPAELREKLKRRIQATIG
ncbi:MAG TPA: hypothetical protein VEH27_13670 [Methylomirabilota bacterium]|nr:hypothetical protein [Methylomirabilota bacterium]